jgi:ABC-type Fe3+ transport system permease subunit
MRIFRFPSSFLLGIDRDGRALDRVVPSGTRSGDRTSEHAMTIEPASPRTSTEHVRLITSAAVVCLAGLAVAVGGAFLPLWQVNNSFDHRFPELPVTWWGVIDPDPHHGVLITSIMVAGVAAAVAISGALLTLTSRRRRPLFGPVAGTVAAVWLLELMA